MILKEILKKHEKIHYLGMCLKMMNDKKFRNKLFVLYDKPDVLLFEHLGEKNIGKNIYLVYCNNPKRGFFSLFNLVLDALQFADFYNMIPVVEWGTSTLYHEDDGLNGVMNSFEYYFEQPGEVTVEEARHSKNVVFYEYNHRKLSIPKFNMTIGASLINDSEMNAYLENRARIIRKYVRFNDNVRKYLEETVIKLFDEKKVLGVHVRGTDMNVGYNGHAKVVMPEEYLEAAKKAFQSGNFEKVFLATDESRVIKIFREEFDNNLFYFDDIMRSDDGRAIHFSQNKRKNHKYMLGLEVVKDMYALSIAEGLIAGVSNVSLAAQMMKKSYGESYSYINILNHGFNHTNKNMH